MEKDGEKPEQVLMRAQDAYKRRAFDETIATCKELLALVDKKLKGLDAQKTRAAALMLMSEAEDVKGSWVNAILYLDGVVQISVSIRDFKMEVEALLRAGNALTKKGKWDDALKKFDRATEVCTRHGNKRMLGRSLVGKGKALWRLGKAMEALQHAKKAQEMGAAVKDEETIAGALTIVSNVKFDQGEYKASIEADKEALKSFEAMNNPFEIARVLNNIGETYKMMGEWPSAIDYFRRSNDVARESGNLRTMGYALANLAECKVRNGDPEGAVESAKAAETAIAGTEDNYAASNVNMIYGMIYAAQGRRDEAEVRFKTAVDEMREMKIPYDTGINQLEYARALAKFKKRDEARAMLREAIASFEEAGAKGMKEKAQKELAAL